jgi:hypothetical protein
MDSLQTLRSHYLVLMLATGMTNAVGCSDGKEPSTGSGGSTSGAGGASGSAAGGGGAESRAGSSGGTAGAEGGREGGRGGSGASGGGANGAGAGGSRAGAGGGGDAGNGTGRPCRNNGECGLGLFCALPALPGPPCRGIACAGDRTPLCTTDTDCPDEQVCQTLYDELCSELYRTCAEPCSASLACEGGMQCQPEGHCRQADHCTLDGTCPSQYRCDTQTRGSTIQGCVQGECAADPDCDEGYCIGTLCYPSLGSCLPPTPPCLAP